jgi:hypothetical protein
MPDRGKAKLAALACRAMLDGLDCSDDERLTVLANLAAWAWQDASIDPYTRADAMLRWFATIQRDVDEHFEHLHDA